MSTAPASPNTTLVTAGLICSCSAHSGITTGRTARNAPTAMIAAPSVTNTGRCSRSTARVPACFSPGRPASAKSAPGGDGTAYITASASTAAARYTQYTLAVPHRVSAAAPRNGPANNPIRCVPPKVDSARARSPYGTASVTYVCRASPHADLAIPVNATDTPSSHSDPATTQPTSATASTSVDSIIVRRSPKRAAMAPAGTSAMMLPSPARAAISPATPIDAPSSRAETTTTGATAPCPTPNRTAGRYTGPMRERRVAGAVPGGCARRVIEASQAPR